MCLSPNQQSRLIEHRAGRDRNLFQCVTGLVGLVATVTEEEECCSLFPDDVVPVLFPNDTGTSTLNILGDNVSFLERACLSACRVNQDLYKGEEMRSDMYNPPPCSFTDSSLFPGLSCHAILRPLPIFRKKRLLIKNGLRCQFLDHTLLLLLFPPIFPCFLFFQSPLGLLFCLSFSLSVSS